MYIMNRSNVEQGQHITMAVMGDTKAGKTYFAATFPNPLIATPINEKGYLTAVDPAHPNSENIRVVGIPQLGPNGTPTGVRPMETMWEIVE